MYAAKRDKKRVMKRTDIKGNKKQTTLYFRLHAELTSNFHYIICLVFVVLVHLSVYNNVRENKYKNYNIQFCFTDRPKRE